MRCASGALRRIDFAIPCMSTVLPVRGGATISARCPKPIGVSKSTARIERFSGSPVDSKMILRVG